MVGVKGLKSTADIDQERLWNEMKRMTLAAIADEPAYVFKRLWTMPVSGQKVRVPKANYLYPEEIAEGATPDYQKLVDNYMHFDIVLKEYALATGITRITLEDSDEQEISWHAARALKAMQDNQEKIILAAVEDTYLDGTLPLGDRRIPPSFGTNPFYNTHNHKVQLGALVEIDLGAIDTAIGNIDEHGHTANFILCNPLDLEKLLYLMTSTDLVGASSLRESFFDPAGAIDGKSAVRRIRGLGILTNAWVARNNYFVFDSRIKPIAWYEKRSITIEQDPRAGFGLAGTWYSNRFGVTMVYATGVVQIQALTA